jgi:hypothetical protein
MPGMSGSGTIIARQLEIFPVFEDSGFKLLYLALSRHPRQAPLGLVWPYTSTWRLPAFNATIASIIPKLASSSSNLGCPLSSVAINLRLFAMTWITVKDS